ncbi:MAG: polymerase sigma factor RpoE [Labilithrix sp.]|nr:polymerase sigma factor RpoE [Labilithrix sp.]
MAILVIRKWLGGHESAVAASISLGEAAGLPVARACSDEERAARQTALVRDHLTFVWRLLRRLGLSPADADDAAQETFLIAVSKMDAILEGHEKSYLAGIAVRSASRARRSQRRRPDQVVTIEMEECRSSAPSPDDLLDRKQARALLELAMSQMSPEVRSAFVLYELEQMTRQEISNISQVPPGTVASRIRIGREHLEAVIARFEKGASRE